MTNREILAYAKIEAYHTAKDFPVFPYRCPSCGARAIRVSTEGQERDECIYACGGSYAVELPRPLVFAGICPEAEEVAESLERASREPVAEDAIREPQTIEEDREQERGLIEFQRKRDAEDYAARKEFQKEHNPKKGKRT